MKTEPCAIPSLHSGISESVVCGCRAVFMQLYTHRKRHKPDNLRLMLMLKSVIYRIAGTAVLVVILAAFTGNVRLALDAGRGKEEKNTNGQDKTDGQGSADAGICIPGQDPAVNRLRNTPFSGASRVFPLSGWTDLDVWEYVRAEEIDIVPLYFSHLRDVEEKGGLLLPSPSIEGGARRVRFRKLVCRRLAAAVESEARTVDEIVPELRRASVRRHGDGI